MSGPNLSRMALVLFVHYAILLALLPWIPNHMKAGAVFFVLALVAFETAALRLIQRSRPAGGDSVASVLLFGACATAVAIGLSVHDLGNQLAGIAIMAGAILVFGVAAQFVK